MAVKKVLYIYNDDGFGGAGLSLLDMLNGIRGMITPVVIIREDAPVEERFAEAGIRCHRIRFSTDFVKQGTADDHLRAYDFAQSYEAALQLLPILKQEEIQLIHINSSVSYFAAIAALMAGIPYVWHIRELLEEQFGCEFLDERLKVSLYQRADALITISDYVQKSYLEKYRLETTRIYDGLHIERFREELGEKPDGSHTFIAPGLITPEKGQWDIVRAVEILRERGFSDIRVTIIGNGDAGYLWAIKKYIRKKNLERNIEILPFCNDLSALRHEASYAITSSQNEALGRVTIEAMLAGNFVIGASSGGTIELIGEDEARGLLYELHDSKALAEAMIRAMELSDAVKDRMRKTAQAYAEAAFDSRLYGRKIVNLYQDIEEVYQPRDEEAFLADLEQRYEAVKDMSVRAERQPEEDIRYRKSEKALGLAVKWLEVRQNGHNLVEYLLENDMHSIAIYGMAALGRRLYDELVGEDIEIKYLLDKNPGDMEQVFDFTSLDGEKMDVDAVVVTVAGAEKQIVGEIEKRGYRKVVGLSELINYFD